MTTTATCPNCGTTITVEPAPVRCACCGRGIHGRREIGESGSVWEGRPLCVYCSALDLRSRATVGPSETKGEL